jgi:hypothetical protein
MTPEVAEVYAGPDPVFRNTFVCFQLAIAEDARVFGHWLADVLEDAERWGVKADARASLRAAALDLCHLERFVGAVRLDLAGVQRHLRTFAHLIGVTLGEDIRPQPRTPAFRETFLALLPEEPRRAARSLGVFLQSTLAEAKAERCRKEARQGAAGELAFLAEHLRELATEPEVFAHLADEQQRLARFAGRMADRLAVLARRVGGEDGRKPTAASCTPDPVADRKQGDRNEHGSRG